MGGVAIEAVRQRRVHSLSEVGDESEGGGRYWLRSGNSEPEEGGEGVEGGGLGVEVREEGADCGSGETESGRGEAAADG